MIVSTPPFTSLLACFASRSLIVSLLRPQLLDAALTRGLLLPCGHLSLLSQSTRTMLFSCLSSDLRFLASLLRLPVRAMWTRNDRPSSEDCLSRTSVSALGVFPRDQILKVDHALIPVAVRFLTLFHHSDDLLREGAMPRRSHYWRALRTAASGCRHGRPISSAQHWADETCNASTCNASLDGFQGNPTPAPNLAFKIGTGNWVFCLWRS
jgi:hypothetical protein